MTRWYVVFDRSQFDKRQWWNIFTGLEFAHVWVFSRAADNAIVVLDPLLTGLDCYVEMTTAEAEHAAQIEAGKRVVVVDVDDENAPVRLFGLYTCVSVIKSVLCCNVWWIVTPKQLYRHLKKHEYEHGQGIDRD